MLSQDNGPPGEMLTACRKDGLRGTAVSPSGVVSAPAPAVVRDYVSGASGQVDG
jgi:hypothetical protein